MITKEVNEWLKKVEKGNYSQWDIMEEYADMSKFLTKEDHELIINKLHKLIKH